MANDYSPQTVALRGITSMATRHMLADAQVLAQGAGCPVAFEAAGGMDVARRIAAGEHFDVACLAADAMAALVDAGHVRAATVLPLVRSPMAMAIPMGSSMPAIETEAALRQLVCSASRIGYSTGPSGKALLSLFERWQLLDALRDRLVQAPAGVPVATLLAHREVDLGFQQRSEFIGMPDIQLLGEMPQGLEIVTTFCAAVPAASHHPAAAQRALEWLASAATDGCKLRHGLLPARA